MATLQADPGSPTAGRLAHLLKSYTSSHPLRSPSPLPAGSRFDPRVPQRSAPPSSASPLLWTLSTWLAFAQFLLVKGLYIVWSLLKHFLFGPQRKSWGYRMTFIISFMRNVANYTDFADIVLLRRLISITYLLPLPADAVVTPITFQVPKRKPAEACRGFLREWDLQETGTRELSGEWVVGNNVWKRLKSERRARWHAELRRRAPHGPSRLREAFGEDGVPSSASSSPVPSHSRRHNSHSSSTGRPTVERESGRDTPEPELEGEAAAPTSRRERVIYYVHGGAYYVGNAATHRLVTIGVSKACNARVFAITYRLAPEATFPLPLLDVLQGYLRLLAPPLSIPPENIIVAGDSAGGGLSLALCMYLRDNNYQMPAGLVLMSPWVDLTMSCGSWDDNGDMDVIPLPEADDHLNPVGCYLGPKGIAAYLTHPYASPLFGDLAGLPPMLIQSGDAEVLRDENTLLAHKATLAGVSVTHELYEDMVHVFQMFTWLPATHAAINSIGRWVRQTLPRIEWEQRQMAEMEAAAEEMDDWYGEHNGPLDEPISTVEGMLAPPPSTSVLGLEPVTETPFRGHAPHIDVDATTQTPTATLPSSGSQRTLRPDQASIPRTYSGLDHVQHYDRDAFLQSPRPPMRRANTTGHRTADSSPVATTAALPVSPRNTFRRRRTTANLQMHMSSPVSPAGTTYANSNPVSPTPSVRRRFRAPTVGSHPTTPSTRSRSHSHTDIFELVEGYVEDGAANATVVYTPGGEIRSVGVLGESDDEE